MKKYIYLGGTTTTQGMVLKKRSIIDEETYLKLKDSPEILSVTFSLEDFAKNKSEI